MHLIDDWRAILKRAWSIKLILAGGLFAGLEGGIQVASVFGYVPEWMPRGAFAILAVFSNAGAFVTRMMTQKGLSDGK